MTLVDTVIARVTGLAFLLIAFAKPFKEQKLCGPDPWETVNVAMFPVEVAVGWMLLVSGRPRRIGAMLGAVLMAGAGLVLSVVQFSGRSVRGCGCFGPIDLPYGAHMLVCALLFAGCIRANRGELRRRRPTTDPAIFD